MEEKTPAKVTILATQDGGYMISGGEFEVIWPSGNVVPTHAIAYLCRCGQSQNKPFCDDSHKRVQFKSREGDETANKSR